MPREKRRTLGAKLLCCNPLCGKVALVILMENSQGCYRINKYLCADCLSEMVMEIPDGDHRQGRDAKKVD